MIIYDLSCDNQHRFEGWFRSADDFEWQIERHLVNCPQCDSATVRRIPSAVAIGGHHQTSPGDGQEASTGDSAARTASLPSADSFATIYRQFVEAVMAHSDNVGKSFAEEARRIHYKEAPERLIRGQATVEECDSLRDEGIEILLLPKIIHDDESH